MAKQSKTTKQLEFEGRLTVRDLRAVLNDLERQEQGMLYVNSLVFFSADSTLGALVDKHNVTVVELKDD